MSSPSDLAERFRSLHVPGTPLLMPNPWDAGSARILQTLGFAALATTSSGFAGSIGRRDGTATRDEALANAAQIVAAVDIPVSADLENCFGDDPAEVAETVRLAAETGLAGCSIEDYDRESGFTFPHEVAVERMAAAAEAAHSGPRRMVLTARADSHTHGGHDLDDTIRRLLAYEEAGADVLYAPAVTHPADLRRILGAVSRPINVLATAGAPDVIALAGLGVARISVGGGFFLAAMAGLVTAARELRGTGTYGYTKTSAVARDVVGEAFA